jgi:hypothetical protein
MKDPRQRKAKRTLSYILVIGLVALWVGWLFVGMARYEVRCERSAPGGRPDCTVTEVRFFGLHVRTVRAEGVYGVGYAIRSPRSSNGEVRGGTVVLTSDTGEVAVSRAVSSEGTEWKAEAVRQIGDFLDDPDRLQFAWEAREINLFGWLWFGITGIVVYCYAAWVARLVRGRR